MSTNLESTVKNVVKEIIKLASTSIAEDVLNALKKAYEEEVNPASKDQIKAMLENVEIARRTCAAVCQDTGLPTFYVKLGDDFPIRSKLYKILEESVIEATKEIPLRPNTVDPIYEKNPGNNTGIGIPIIDLELVPGNYVEIIYVPKGGGSELPGKALVLAPGIAWSRLPKIVLDTVVEAGAIPCPPVIIGIGIAGTIELATKLAKRAAVIRPVGSRHPDPKVAKLEEELLNTINKLGIGPHGTGGKFTALDVHIEYAYRHVATFALAITFNCWVARRARTIIYSDGKYEIKPY